MVFLLDNGHGGVLNGTYLTCPNYDLKDSKTWHKMWIHDGVPFYEGEFNRKLVDEIFWLARNYDFTLVNLVPEVKDISIKERVRRANDYYDNVSKDCIFVSIHGNAFNTSATGIEVFTSKGDTPADPLADILLDCLAEAFPRQAIRWDLSDGDKDKEANFYVLSKTKMPSLLGENGFFDKIEDVETIMSEEGISKLAKAYVKAFNIINNAKL